MKKVDHDEKRAEIAACAATLIAQEGLEALTTRRLAQSMECTIGVLSHYFASKEQIVIAALNWANERIFDRMSEALEQEADLESFGTILASALPLNATAELEWRVRLNTWTYALINQELLALQRQRSQYVAEMILSLMKNLQRAGQIRADIPIDQATNTLIDLILGVGFEMLHLSKKQRAAHAKNITFFLKTLR